MDECSLNSHGGRQIFSLGIAMPLTLTLFPNVSRLTERTVSSIISTVRSTISPVWASTAKDPLEFLFTRFIPPTGSLEQRQEQKKLCKQFHAITVLLLFLTSVTKVLMLVS